MDNHDILALIFSMLDTSPSELFRLRLVNREWNALISAKIHRFDSVGDFHSALCELDGLFAKVRTKNRDVSVSAGEAIDNFRDEQDLYIARTKSGKLKTQDFRENSAKVNIRTLVRLILRLVRGNLGKRTSQTYKSASALLFRVIFWLVCHSIRVDGMKMALVSMALSLRREDGTIYWTFTLQSSLPPPLPTTTTTAENLLTAPAALENIPTAAEETPRLPSQPLTLYPSLSAPQAIVPASKRGGPMPPRSSLKAAPAAKTAAKPAAPKAALQAKSTPSLGVVGGKALLGKSTTPPKAAKSLAKQPVVPAGASGSRRNGAPLPPLTDTPSSSYTFRVHYVDKLGPDCGCECEECDDDHRRRDFLPLWEYMAVLAGVKTRDSVKAMRCKIAQRP
eukprot:TRINITY_DN8870_c0_g1_i1.p1 TRINITY_DN8870_c0_g1~~TRINITY_DN8870_c0_g1_i1.p1  ORF type:complete len:393 (-),score=55.45 TRINITY_DN8870_c0_g1_i1:4-1182(-)